MRAYERLIEYAGFETGSNGHTDERPTNPEEVTFGKALVGELQTMGIAAEIDEHGVVYAKIPANVEGVKRIGFIAHLDTVGDVDYQDVHPCLIPEYDCEPLKLMNGTVLSPSESPALFRAKGKTLLVTDGNTLLGADDKAGVAEIMTLCEILSADPSVPHGEVSIAFTPDEEIGIGADYFDVEKFGADYAFTLDGGEFGELEYECFNGSSAYLTFKGKSIHTGTAKGCMIHAARLAMEFDSMIPQDERPENTEGYEGFYHVTDLRGRVEKAILRYIIRDHDLDKLRERENVVRRAAAAINEKYGEGSCTLELEDTYFNMAQIIRKYPELTEKAAEAIRLAGGEVRTNPIRGGTDGARISYMGLPTPNLGTGSGNHHGKCEYAVVEDMDKAVSMMKILLRLFAEERKN